ncbi:MAG: sensor histidine kinase [Clostridiales bacterium]|nr:sensor histidine kinase [Clostridiales bacterium]
MRDVSSYILESVKNGVEADAKKIHISVDENIHENCLRIVIQDDGIGMSREKIEEILRPFRVEQKKKSVGLGIPLFKHACECCGGNIHLISEPQKGTFITAEMEYNHIDRPPLGDMAEMMSELIQDNPDVEFIYTHKYNGKMFIFDQEKTRGMIGDFDPKDPEIEKWMKGTIQSGIENLRQP